MTDEQIRQILIEKRKSMQREAANREIAESILCWACWVAMGCMAYLGAYMIG